MLTELMEGLENINKHFQPSGLSLLSIAVANEALECVKILLKAGADPNQWDLSEKITALHTVAQTGLQADRPAYTCQLLDLLVPRLRRMLRAGTTTVECKSGYGLNTETEVKMLRVLDSAREIVPIEISSTFCGAHAVPKG